MNAEKKELLIVIPAHNEEANIGQVLDQLKKQSTAQVADILVINDASTDRTEAIVRAAGCLYVTHIFNLGYGSGLQAGYRYALEHGYQYVIQLDADGQHDACNVPAIYDCLRQEQADGRCPDIVLGSRFLPGSSSFPISAAKKAGIQFFRQMIWLSAHRRILDPTTGLQGLSRDAVEYYAGYLHFDDRYPDANMILQMLLLGFHVVEIPAVMHPRTSGVSMHSGLEPVLYMARMLFSVLAVLFRCQVLKIDHGAGDRAEQRQEITV